MRSLDTGLGAYSPQDYYVYMTYDLHGQWDYNNTFVK
jgi:GH18 family chitinase